MVDAERIVAKCREYNVCVVEDAAEALGGERNGQPAGSLGDLGILSFNGNKIITTSGGGALLGDVEPLARARYLSTQAREEKPYYWHSEVGYNYRMSNLLAALGNAQLANLATIVANKRAIRARYKTALEEVGINVLDFDSENHFSNAWLTVADLSQSDLFPDEVVMALKEIGAEARRSWTPLHMQPLFRDSPHYGGSRAEQAFENLVCLPSGAGLTVAQQSSVCEKIRDIADP